MPHPLVGVKELQEHEGVRSLVNAGLKAVSVKNIVENNADLIAQVNWDASDYEELGLSAAAAYGAYEAKEAVKRIRLAIKTEVDAGNLPPNLP